MSVVIDHLQEETKHVLVGPGEVLTYIIPILASVPEPRKREIVLNGEGAEARVFGLYLGRGDDQLNLTLDTTHAAPNTRGRTEFKAVLSGRSSLEFNGMIKILKQAQNSNDFLQQDTLLLSSDARANAVPGLEIEANEVKASHGATAKPVDPEQKFYLMSRGLSEQQAEQMIVVGFISTILNKVQDDSLKARILDSLETELQVTPQST